MPRWTGGGELGAGLDELLLARATEAAEAVAPGRVVLAAARGGAGTGEGLGGEGVPECLGGTGVGEDLGGAVARAWPDGGASGPLLVLWPDLPRWRPAHLEAALSDLEDGCDVAIGPVFGGGFYLLGLVRPVPGLFERSADAWRSPDAIAVTLALATTDKLTVGLLRAERALGTAGDVAAVLADPLADDELRGLLG
jgi:hypothetical protein